jgi:hypothetical protein
MASANSVTAQTAVITCQQRRNTCSCCHSSSQSRRVGMIGSISGRPNSSPAGRSLCRRLVRNHSPAAAVIRPSLASRNRGLPLSSDTAMLSSVRVPNIALSPSSRWVRTSRTTSPSSVAAAPASNATSGSVPRARST